MTNVQFAVARKLIVELVKDEPHLQIQSNQAGWLLNASRVIMVNPRLKRNMVPG